MERTLNAYIKSQEKIYERTREHNNIQESISKMETAQEYLKLRQDIAYYANKWNLSQNDSSVQNLNTKLTLRLNEVEQEIQSKVDSLNEQIESFKKDVFVEDTQTLKELQVRSEQKFYEIMLKMNKNKESIAVNRRMFGNYLSTGDRASAMALAKILSMPQYTGIFNDKKKALVIENCKSEAQKAHERLIEKSISEKSAELGREYMKGLNIRNAKRLISNTEYHFRKE